MSSSAASAPLAMLRPVSMLQASAPPIPLMRGLNVIGRGSGGLMSQRLSRQHLHLRSIDTDAAISFTVESLGSNGSVLRSADGTERILRPDGIATGILAMGDKIQLLPGDVPGFCFSLEEAASEPELSPTKRARTSPAEATGGGGSSFGAASRAGGVGVDVGGRSDVGGNSGGGGGGGGGGDGGGGGGGTTSGGDSSGDSWSGVVVKPFTQPPKPVTMEGLRALESLALSADAPRFASRVLSLAPDLVCAYDCYPKARAHLLILPRTPLSGPQELTAAHAPLVRRMAAYGQHVAATLRARDPSLAPFRLGFHAVPSMRQLHLHVISADMSSDCLKNKKHWNSFTTDFFVPPERWADKLEADGRLQIDERFEEAKLKRDMVCHLSGVALRNMPALKQHVAGREFQRRMLRDAQASNESHGS